MSGGQNRIREIVRESVCVRPDCGKDDSGLSPGVYAVAHDVLAGPARTREDAMEALARYLWAEGVVIANQEIEPEFFVWPPDPIADAARGLGAPSEEFTRLNDAWLEANERLERTALAASSLTNLAWFAVGVLVGACVIGALAVLVGGS